MFSLIKCLIILPILAIFWLQTNCEADWTYEYVSIDSQSKTPDILKFDLYVTRISRGQYAVSGTVEAGEDINNDTLINILVYYSYTSQDYIRSPFQIPKSDVPTFVKTHYKDLLMNSIKECATNPPDLEADGVVTKRLAVLDNCFVSTENMPSHLKSGYYKIAVLFTGRATATLEIVVKIEAKD